MRGREGAPHRRIANCLAGGLDAQVHPHSLFHRRRCRHSRAHPCRCLRRDHDRAQRRRPRRRPDQRQEHLQGLSDSKGVTQWLIPPSFSSTARSLTRPAFAACTTSFSGEEVTIIAPPNPLRGLSGGDGDYLKGVIDEIDGPVLLVGHSYGGRSSPRPARLTTWSASSTSPGSLPTRARTSPTSSPSSRRRGSSPTSCSTSCLKAATSSHARA